MPGRRAAPLLDATRPALEPRAAGDRASRPPALVTWLTRYRSACELGAIGGAVALAAVLLFLDRTLVQYVDESDNWLGGRLISRGYRLYVDYFSQHMPVPYYIAALASRLGLHDLVGYRVFYSALIVVFLGYFCLQFRRRISVVFLGSVVLLFGIGHPMFSGYMLLADDIFAFALLLVVTFVLVADVDFSLPEQVAISLACFAAIQSTLISIYPMLWIAAYYVVRKVYRQARGGPRIQLAREAGFVGLLVAPHLLLAGLLVAQGSVGSFVDQAIRFNQLYYSKYDIGGDPLSILTTSLTEFKDVAAKYLRPSMLREVETVLLASNIAAVFVVWKRRDALFAAFFVGLVILSRMRGVGYHGSPYFLVSFASIGLVLAFAADAAASAARHWSTPRWNNSRRLGRAAAGLALLAYAAWAALFYHDVAGFYVRLPRAASEVEDVQSAYAAVVDAATSPGDRIWTAPDEPYVYLKADRLPASTYWFYHPWMADSPEVTEGVLRDLAIGQPPLIIFRADKDVPWNFPLPTPRQYGARVFAFIQTGWIAVDDHDPLLRDVFVRPDRVDDVRARLEQRGLLKPVDASGRFPST